MKIRCLIIAILITALNFVLSLCIETLWLKLLLNFCVIAIGMSLLYYWLVSPIREMKKQLKAVEEENRQLEAMRKEFVANVTHELKTPLTSITGFIETLQNGAAEDPEIRTKFIDIIAIEAARLKRLIEDTLVLSEIERKVEILSEQIQVKAAIDSIITVINPIAKENQVSLINEVPEDIYVRGNEDRFRQMMVNLIENA
ncbi:MAG: histidine kinase dimerization/phospho-acceptor domain-containing protein, partial [Anaerovoracaceae bacterium]